MMVCGNGLEPMTSVMRAQGFATGNVFHMHNIHGAPLFTYFTITYDNITESFFAQCLFSRNLKNFSTPCYW